MATVRILTSYESGVSCNLCLNAEELARAHKDEQFVSSLLFHAKVTNSQRPALSAPIEQAAETSETNQVEDHTTKINQRKLEPSRFDFYELMDEILGADPTNSCLHAINSNQFDPTMEDILESPCLATSTSYQSVSSEVQENNKDTKQIKKISEKTLKREYIELKREEEKNRQKRHEDLLALEQHKIVLENRKLDLLEKYLNAK
ncbi:hypothetical protein ILUMI_18333 [Ignelater luminosus]|uniref:Uncharacterized protein n=1 Tax=Ignelater luminosus TaxID=2038154 RepID=A0A8K0CK33_IGNLU|nr:hypothetical protein ILUMI_18333 [Ignelater luminosus]